MDRRLKRLALIWGLLWLGIGSVAGLLYLITALVGRSEWRLSLGLMVPLLAGGVGGGLVTLSTLRALGRASAKPLRLPPGWALGGGFVLALAVGLGLGEAEISRAFLMPAFAALAAALAPLAIVAWILAGRPGAITARRGGAAYGLGATAGTILAFLLNMLLPTGILFLVFGLADELLPQVEDLMEALVGPLTEDLLSPWFLITLVEVAVVVPLVEELVKPLSLLPLLRRLPSRRDALLMGALAGAGFAAVENLLYAAMFGSAWGGVLAGRALGAALHPFGAGLMAVAWRDVLRREPVATAHWVRNYGLAVGIHALWNATCIVAATVAGAWFQGWEVELLGRTEAVVLFALLALEGAGMLMALRALARRLELAEGEGVAPPPSMPVERAVAIWGLVCLVVLVPVGLGVLQMVW